MNNFLGGENKRKEGTLETVNMRMDEEWHIE